MCVCVFVRFLSLCAFLRAFLPTKQGRARPACACVRCGGFPFCVCARVHAWLRARAPLPRAAKNTLRMPLRSVVDSNEDQTKYVLAVASGTSLRGAGRLHQNRIYSYAEIDYAWKLFLDACCTTGDLLAALRCVKRLDPLTKKAAAFKRRFRAQYNYSSALKTFERSGTRRLDQESLHSTKKNCFPSAGKARREGGGSAAFPAELESALVLTVR
jgi:hypothetical protein